MRQASNAPWKHEDPDEALRIGPAAGYARFFLFLVATSVIVVGGGLWLRQQAMDGLHRDNPPVAQVHILFEPGPVPTPMQSPIPVSDPIVETSVSPITRLAEPVREETPAIATPAVPPEPAARPAAAPRPETTLNVAASTNRSSALRFQRTLLRHIAQFQSYPDAARRSHLQGTVLVLFAMRRDGSVADIWVKSSSGTLLLDHEAVETIRRAQPLPAIPSDLPNRLNVLVPVAFGLS